MFEDGDVVYWGADSAEGYDLHPPAGLKAVAIAAGSYHALAIRPDGSVVAWGLNTEGQCDVPTITDAVQVSAGAKFSMALQKDGTVQVWGVDNALGGYENGVCDVPTDLLHDVVQIHAGSTHATALCLDGTVVEWGNLTADDGFSRHGPATFDRPNISEIRGGKHYVAFEINFDGSLTVRLTSGSLQNSYSVPRSGTRVVWADGGANFACAIQADGTFYSWAKFTSDLSGHPQGLPVAAMAVSPPRDPFVGVNHILTLLADGTVFAWGSASAGFVDYGQLTVPDGLVASHVAAGSVFSLAIASDAVPRGWDSTRIYGRVGDAWEWFSTGTHVPVTGAQVSVGAYLGTIAADGYYEVIVPSRLPMGTSIPVEVRVPGYTNSRELIANRGDYRNRLDFRVWPSNAL